MDVETIAKTLKELRLDALRMELIRVTDGPDTWDIDPRWVAMANRMLANLDKEEFVNNLDLERSA